MSAACKNTSKPSNLVDPILVFNDNKSRIEMAIRYLSSVSDLCVAVADADRHAGLDAVNADNLAHLLDFIRGEISDAVAKLEYPK